MKGKATTSTASIVVHERQSHAPSFAKVFDGNKQPIRGLWIRNGRYYAQLTIEDAATGIKQVRRVSLTNKDVEAVQTVAEAKAVMERLRTQRADDALPVLRRTPKFTEYLDHYLGHIANAKKERTVAKEKSTLNAWKEFFQSN